MIIQLSNHYSKKRKYVPVFSIFYRWKDKDINIGEKKVQYYNNIHFIHYFLFSYNFHLHCLDVHDIKCSTFITSILFGTTRMICKLYNRCMLIQKHYIHTELLSEKTFYIVLNTQLIALEASLFSYQCFYIILLSIPSIVIIIPFPIHQYWRNWRQRNNVEYYGLKNWNGMKTQHSSILHSLLVAGCKWVITSNLLHNWVKFTASPFCDALMFLSIIYSHLLATLSLTFFRYFFFNF